MQQQHDERERDENGDDRMHLADLLEPAQQSRGIGIDPVHLRGLVGHGNLDQLVQLLIDAAFQQFDQPLPGDVGAAVAAQLLDLAQLVQGVLIFGLDGVEPDELRRLVLALGLGPPWRSRSR